MSSKRKQPVPRHHYVNLPMRLIAVAARNPMSAGGMLVTVIALGAIVLNATVAQSGRHPAPLLSTRPFAGIDGKPVGSVRRARTAKRAIEPAPPSPLIRDVQLALTELGYYHEDVDGLQGPKTRSAIKAYQAKANLPVTGNGSPALLAHIRMNPGNKVKRIPLPTRSPATTHKPSSRAADDSGAETREVRVIYGEARHVVRESRVRQIQKALADLGYGPVRIDGRFGDQTAAAIQRFELDQGLNVRGEISGVLIAELERIGGFEDE